MVTLYNYICTKMFWLCTSFFLRWEAVALLLYIIVTSKLHFICIYRLVCIYWQVFNTLEKTHQHTFKLGNRLIWVTPWVIRISWLSLEYIRLFVYFCFLCVFLTGLVVDYVLRELSQWINGSVFFSKTLYLCVNDTCLCIAITMNISRLINCSRTVIFVILIHQCWSLFDFSSFLISLGFVLGY